MSAVTLALNQVAVHPCSHSAPQVINRTPTRASTR